MWCALLRNSLAEARPHGHRIRSAAAASNRLKYHIHPPRLRAAARSRPRRELTDRPRSTRAHCAPRTLVVMWANSRHAPPRFHGHGSAARPPHQVGGCGFETKLSSTIAWSRPRAVCGSVRSRTGGASVVPPAHARVATEGTRDESALGLARAVACVTGLGPTARLSSPGLATDTTYQRMVPRARSLS